MQRTNSFSKRTDSLSVYCYFGGWFTPCKSASILLYLQISLVQWQYKLGECAYWVFCSDKIYLAILQFTRTWQRRLVSLAFVLHAVVVVAIVIARFRCLRLTWLPACSLLMGCMTVCWLLLLFLLLLSCQFGVSSFHKFLCCFIEYHQRQQQ